jgi:hypothetical protein
MAQLDWPLHNTPEGELVSEIIDCATQKLDLYPKTIEKREPAVNLAHYYLVLADPLRACAS